MERRNKVRPVRPIRRRKQKIPESYLILRILSIILAFAVLEINFINVWSLNILFLVIILAVYSVFIFYPKRSKNTITDTVRFALGVVFLFVGIDLLVYVAASTAMRDFPINVGVMISFYALFWIVVGWIFLVKSHYTKIASRFIKN
ncbi:MAG TPA: hypothetical protein VMR16_00865 [Candidatus Saccharimonadales bacterium]|nr:hypothetical protein [Candidatus Saccharimonadales bacterium]